MSAVNWIKITERAREGIKIIDALPYPVFITVLNYVFRQMSPATTPDTTSGGDADSVEPENALEQLERLVGVPRADFLLLIKTFSYILRRTSTVVIKPTRLQAELREKLQLQDLAKIDAIVRLWVRQTTPIMNNLASDRYESNEIRDVAWKLNVEISSHCQQRAKTALAVLQLKTGAGEDINLEMNHEQLLALYQQFECIQGELDAMKQSQTSQQQQQQLTTAEVSAATLTPTSTAAATIRKFGENWIMDPKFEWYKNVLEDPDHPPNCSNDDESCDCTELEIADVV